jgi:gas vesicle protein
MTIPLLACALLAGCATTRLEKIDDGQSIAIVSGNRGAEGATIDISNKVVGTDAGTGAMGGMVAFAPLGLSCGPWAVLCVPFTAMVGAGVGALGGSVVGLAESLSSDTRQQLRAKLDAYRAVNDPRQRVVEAIAGQAKDRWTIRTSGAARTLVVTLEEVSLHALREDRIALVVKADVSIHRAGDPVPTYPDAKTFVYLGSSSDVRQWVEDRNDFVARSFGAAFEYIGRMVVADLAR